MDVKDCSSFLTDIANKASIGLGISLGINLGLFDLLAANQNRFISSKELADSAQYKERYVREWLGLMVVGKIVEMDNNKENYRLLNGFENHFVHHEGRQQEFPGVTRVMLYSTGAAVFNELENCYRKDGPRGMHYNEFKDFHGTRNNAFKAEGSIGSRLDGILSKSPELLTALNKGVSILEVGCSTGLQAEELAKRYSSCTILATDVNTKAIDDAKNRTKNLSLKNLKYDVQDGNELPALYESKYDVVIVVNVIHDVPYPDIVLKEIYKVLKQDGIFLMADNYAHSCPVDNIDERTPCLKYFASLTHCVPVSMAYENGKGLGNMWGIEVQEKMLQDTGFSVLRIERNEDKSIATALKK